MKYWFRPSCKNLIVRVWKRRAWVERTRGAHNNYKRGLLLVIYVSLPSSSPPPLHLIFLGQTDRYESLISPLLQNLTVWVWNHKVCAERTRGAHKHKKRGLLLFLSVYLHSLHPPPPPLFNVLVNTDIDEALMFPQLQKSNRGGVKSYVMAPNNLTTDINILSQQKRLWHMNSLGIDQNES